MKYFLILLLQYGIWNFGFAQKFETVVNDYKPTIQIPAKGIYKLIRTSPRSAVKNALRMSVPDGHAHDIGIYFAPGHRPATGQLIARGRTFDTVDIPTQVGSYIICSLGSGMKYLKIVMLHVYDDRIEIYQIDTLAPRDPSGRLQQAVFRS